MLPVSVTPAVAHTVVHAWMDSLDHTVRWTSMSACLVLVLMGQLVWMALINMTAPVLINFDYAFSFTYYSF